MTIYSVSEKTLQSLDFSLAKLMMQSIRDYHETHFHSSSISLELPISRPNSTSLSTVNIILRILTGLYISFVCVVPLGIGLDLNIYLSKIQKSPAIKSKFLISIDSQQDFIISNSECKFALFLIQRTP